MYKTKIRWDRSLFELLWGLFFLFFFSTSVLASPEELAAVREQIQNNRARWQAEETSISQLPAEQRRMRLGLVKAFSSPPEGAPAPSTKPAGGGTNKNTTADFELQSTRRR